MNRFFRWGIVIALLIVVACGVMAMRIIFVPSEDVSIPPLVGQSTVDAVKRLEELGLTALIDQVESDQPEGTVISQNYDPGQKTAKGRKVTIKVSKGGSQSQIPDVRGLEFAVAVKTLDAAGFKVGTVLRVPDQLKAAGTIIAQNPAAPAMVPGTRMVDLLISEGKNGKAEMVLVPDLQGQTEGLAKQILEQSDLTVARSLFVRSEVVPAGNVVRTQPRSGARVPSGQGVVLYIAQAPSSADQAGATVVPATMPEPDASQPPAADPSISTTPPSQTTRPVTQPVQTPQPDPGTQQTPPAAGTEPSAPATQPVQQPSTTPQESVARKTAKVRYQVPPLSRPLSLKIEISDQNGSRVLKDEQAKGGEYMTIDAPYAGTATVAIHLGGELVWQERYQ